MLPRPKYDYMSFSSIADPLINGSLFQLQYSVDLVGLAQEKNKTAGRKEGIHHRGWISSTVHFAMCNSAGFIIFMSTMFVL